jgi:hypothetical protein
MEYVDIVFGYRKPREKIELLVERYIAMETI